MRSLFWKGMLAFLAVILIAVGTVALLAGRVAENEFRRYASANGGVFNRHVIGLAALYSADGSWDDLQEVLPALRASGSMGRGGPGSNLQYQVADSAGLVVGDTSGPPQGTLSQEELDRSIPIEVGGETVGYLVPILRSPDGMDLDPPQLEYLKRIQVTLWAAATAAMIAALVIGGVLFRSIIAPLQQLTRASRTVAEGDLSVRAQVRGQDEVAELAQSFNHMTENLARAEVARRQQTADIAHELRTPITVIQGTLEAMFDGVYEANEENLMAALGQVHTLSRLVEDLQLLALADAGRLRIHTTPLDLAKLVRDVVEANRPRAQDNKIDLTLQAPPALPLVLADRDRVTQVLGGLLDNCLRYLPEGKRIGVQVTDHGREVHVAIVDDGPGVPASDLPHLFKRFWRGDSSRNRETGGSGLGLAIARHIIGAHGGRIWAEETPGGGLTITFSLRAAELA